MTFDERVEELWDRYWAQRRALANRAKRLGKATHSDSLYKGHRKVFKPLLSEFLALESEAQSDPKLQDSPKLDQLYRTGCCLYDAVRDNFAYVICLRKIITLGASTDEAVHDLVHYVQSILCVHGFDQDRLSDAFALVDLASCTPASSKQLRQGIHKALQEYMKEPQAELGPTLRNESARALGLLLPADPPRRVQDLIQALEKTLTDAGGAETA